MPRKYDVLITHMPLKIVLIIGVVASSLFFIKGGSYPNIDNKEEIIVLRLAEALTEDNPVTKSMHIFAKLVYQKTEGKIQVNVYSGGQLGEEIETIEQTRMGIIDFTRANAIVLANVSPSMGVFTLPYIFRDRDHKYQVLDGDIGVDVREKLKDVGLIGFDFLESGPRSFYTRADRSVKSLADMKGLKIRVQPAPIMIRMIELLGAVPTPLNYGDVYSAIHTGVVDGAENDFVSYASSAHFEVASNYIEDEHLNAPAVLLMNARKFSSLPKSFQQAIYEAAKEAALIEREMMNQANIDAKLMLQQKNVSITTIDNAPFRAAMAPLYKEFPAYGAYIDRINGIE